MASLEASPQYTGEASQEEAANLAKEATQPLSIARAKGTECMSQKTASYVCRDLIHTAAAGIQQL